MQHFIFIPASILSNYKHRRILFPNPSTHSMDRTRGARVGSTRGMIRSGSGTIALCVAGKRRKIIDHGPVNMNGGRAVTGATLLRREICKKETGTTRNDQAIRFDRAPSIGSFSEGA